MLVYLVIPGLNVEKSVGRVVKDCKRYVSDIIFVDDGSKDRSSEVASAAGAEVIRLPENRGKGFALRTGFAQALAEGADVVICMDSDGQTDPKYLPEFIESIKDVDVVIGSRSEDKFSTSTINYIGNHLLNLLTNLISFGPKALFKKSRVNDTQSGYRAFRASALKKMRLEGNRYEIEGEMIYEIGHRKLSFKEIPIKSMEKIRGVKIRDGLKNGLFLFKKVFRL